MNHLKNYWHQFSRWERLALLSIFLAAIFARLAYLLWVVGPNAYPVNIDSVEHDMIARSLLEGKGYELYGHPSAYRAPFLTYLMAGIYWIFGTHYLFVRLAIIIFSLVLIAAVYYLTRQIFNRNTALWSAFIVAVYPHFIFYSSRIFTEIPFALFLILALIAFLRFQKSGRSYHLLLGGVWLGLAALTRPVGLALFGLLLLYLLLCSPHFRIKYSLILAGMVLLLILPWSIRNYRVFERVVPVTTQGGVVLWISNNHYVAHHPQLWGSYTVYQRLPGAEKLIVNNEVTRSRWGLRFTMQFFKNYPEDIPRLIWNKFRRFWHYEFFTGSAHRRMYEYSYLLILLFALPGALIAMLRRIPGTSLLWILILANLMPALIFWAGARIRFPAEPAIIIFAAFSLEQLRIRIWEKLI